MSVDRELHHFITEAGRFRILQTIRQHTEQLPTAYEITQFCSDLSTEAVETRLADLIERDIVEEVRLPPAKRQEKYPDTFYGVTDHGWRLLMNHNLLDSEGTVRRWQDIAAEDPATLARHESAPRPDDVETFQHNPVNKIPARRTEAYKMIVEQTQDALYMLDAEEQYVLVNEAYEELTGYSREDLIGSTPQKVLGPEERAERRDLIADLLSAEADRESYAWQSTLQTADGGTLPVEVNFGVLEHNDEYIGIVGSARDISDRKRREQELSVLSRVLRHNLGNKVNIIQGYAEVIEDVVEDERALEYTERIRRTSTRLIQQSEKARDIHGLLREWPPETRHRDVTTIVRDVLTEMEMKFPEARLTTDMPDAAWARLPDEFRMAIEELIRNAIEHADADEPEVHVHISDPEADEVIAITVEDDGPGIPEHEINVLTSDEETPLEHSEGIGLWMVTWIVNAADGDIAFVESDLGGSCIRLEFPETEPPALKLSV